MTFESCELWILYALTYKLNNINRHTTICTSTCAHNSSDASCVVCALQQLISSVFQISEKLR